MNVIKARNILDNPSVQTLEFFLANTQRRTGDERTDQGNDVR
jgi:hypothetical protein